MWEIKIMSNYTNYPTGKIFGATVILIALVILTFYWLGRETYKPSPDTGTPAQTKDKTVDCKYTTEGCKGTPSDAKM